MVDVSEGKQTFARDKIFFLLNQKNSGRPYRSQYVGQTIFLSYLQRFMANIYM